jgi:leucyl-tRNA synthetase
MVSALMEFVNVLYGRVRENEWQTATFQESLAKLMVILAPAAPYISEELWSQTGHGFSIHQQTWPSWDEALVHDERVNIAIQVNGKTRGSIFVQISTSETEALQLVDGNPDFNKYLDGQEVARLVYVPGKILNVLTKKRMEP